MDELKSYRYRCQQCGRIIKIITDGREFEECPHCTGWAAKIKEGK